MEGDGRKGQRGGGEKRGYGKGDIGRGRGKERGEGKGKAGGFSTAFSFY